MSPSSALVLSGSIGKGHDSVAEACGAAVATVGLPAVTLDCMALMGGASSRVGMEVFRRILSVPSVYDAFHFAHLRTGGRLPAAMERASTNRLLPPLRRALGTAGVRPLVLPVFPTGVAAAGRLKAEQPRLRTVAMCTDACAHSMWVHEGIDLYVTCSQLAASTVRRYDPGARLAVVPPPVRPAFFSAPVRAEARAGLGLPADVPCVLLMAGGWGLGPLADTAAALARQGYEVLAVAAMNRALYAQLCRLARHDPKIHPFAFTDAVPHLMAAADAVVTSPGQTCHEARVVGRWLVVLDVVPGHGRENTLHELETGAALACSPDPASVVGAVGVMFAERPEQPPWPVGTARDWQKHFLGALEDAGIDLEL